jgi:PKHD-type hydroxylase
MLLHIPNVLTAEQLAQARQLLDNADWVDGRGTAGYQSAQAKRNLQLPDGDPAARAIGSAILDALGRNDTFFAAALPRRVFPPLFNCYQSGQDFGYHVDNAIRFDHLSNPQHPQPVRTDLSATLFLSEPDEYDGGELEIEDTYGNQRVKLPAGHMVLYPGTSLHRVTPVTHGARVASFFWIQSMVRDDAQRRLLWEQDMAIRRLTADHPGHPSLISLTGVYHNLLRQWAEA